MAKQDKLAAADRQAWRTAMSTLQRERMVRPMLLRPAAAASWSSFCETWEEFRATNQNAYRTEFYDLNRKISELNNMFRAARGGGIGGRRLWRLLRRLLEQCFGGGSGGGGGGGAGDFDPEGNSGGDRRGWNLGLSNDILEWFRKLLIEIVNQLLELCKKLAPLVKDAAIEAWHQFWSETGRDIAKFTINRIIEFFFGPQFAHA
jgi:hypothetical protein